MKTFVLLVSLLFLFSCVETQVVKLGTPTVRPVVAPENVAVYRTAAQVPGRYEEVALLTATGDIDLASQQALVKAMKKKAGALGANAIILDAMSEPSEAVKIASMLLSQVSAERKGKAMAIFVFPVEKK
jgi:hypothetical protein